MVRMDGPLKEEAEEAFFLEVEDEDAGGLRR